jgi:hypothetical protein
LIGRNAVTAEVASSSLVVPAIHPKAVRRISLKPSRAQKGHVSRPFCALFRRPTVSYPATSGAPSLSSEEKTSDITAACAACFAGVELLSQACLNRGRKCEKKRGKNQQWAKTMCPTFHRRGLPLQIRQQNWSNSAGRCRDRFQVPMSLRVVSEARWGKAPARAECVGALSIQP